MLKTKQIDKANSLTNAKTEDSRYNTKSTEKLPIIKSRIKTKNVYSDRFSQKGEPIFNIFKSLEHKTPRYSTELLEKSKQVIYNNRHSSKFLNLHQKNNTLAFTNQSSIIPVEFEKSAINQSTQLVNEDASYLNNANNMSGINIHNSDYNISISDNYNNLGSDMTYFSPRMQNKVQNTTLRHASEHDEKFQIIDNRSSKFDMKKMKMVDMEQILRKDKDDANNTVLIGGNLQKKIKLRHGCILKHHFMVDKGQVFWMDCKSFRFPLTLSITEKRQPCEFYISSKIEYPTKDNCDYLRTENPITVNYGEKETEVIYITIKPKISFTTMIKATFYGINNKQPVIENESGLIKTYAVDGRQKVMLPYNEHMSMSKKYLNNLYDVHRVFTNELDNDDEDEPHPTSINEKKNGYVHSKKQSNIIIKGDENHIEEDHNDEMVPNKNTDKIKFVKRTIFDKEPKAKALMQKERKKAKLVSKYYRHFKNEMTSAFKVFSDTRVENYKAKRNELTMVKNEKINNMIDRYNNFEARRKENLFAIINGIMKFCRQKAWVKQIKVFLNLDKLNNYGDFYIKKKYRRLRMMTSVFILQIKIRRTLDKMREETVFFPGKKKPKKITKEMRSNIVMSQYIYFFFSSKYKNQDYEFCSNTSI